MNEQINKKMQLLKKVFFALLLLDLAGLLFAVIALVPTFKQMADYGRLMLAVTGVIAAVFVAVLLFDVLAKIFLIRSTSPTFSWKNGRKGYVLLAKLLFLFNLAAFIINLLSRGGEGATLLNQGYLYLRVLACVVEMAAAGFYLHIVKQYQ